MTKSGASNLQQLIAAVDLEQIRLIEVKGRTSISSPEELGEAELKIDGKTEARRDTGSDMVIVIATLETTLLPKRAPTEPGLSLLCVFELKYRVPASVDAPQDVLSEFARTNGLYNAWPYCRELVQNTVTRMALPPLLIPLLKFNRPATATKRENAQG
jgi:hypothetical protein